MSYILDALKKSEAERSNRDNAEFAHRVPFEAAPRRQREIWPYLLVLALVANALVVVYVMWPQSGPDDSAGSGETAVVQRQESVEPETTGTEPEQPVQEEDVETPEKTVASDASTPARESAPVVPEETPSKTDGGASPTESQDLPAPENPADEQDERGEQEPEKTEAPPEVPGIDAMPRSVQRRVPEMTFNAHLYSSRPSSRQVMINNRKLREGDRVGDLVIKEITPAGAVFRLDEHVFQIGIVRDWQGSR